MKAATPPFGSQPLQIEIINDQYFACSPKNGTRLSRGSGCVSKRVHLESVDQHMLQGGQWESFFHNGSNKEDLIKLAVSYFKTDECRSQLRVPLIITSKNETWKICNDGVYRLHCCNHEEADTRIVLHALEEDTDVVIVANDTDVFILLLYAMTFKRNSCKWYTSFYTNEYIDLGKVYESYGYEICRYLSQFHAITGCDTTSYRFNVGKKRVFHKCEKDISLLLLVQNLGQRALLDSETAENVT